MPPLFYLGTHEVSFLEKTDVPLFLSNIRLMDRKTFPRARGIWALDSGGYSQLSTKGCWTFTAEAYVANVKRYSSEIGGLQWAATMDWMCEAEVLKKTGLSIPEHQARTVASYLELKALAPEIPWAPVLQGWTRGDYEDCVELYLKAGVDLFKQPIVPVGTMCRRQASIPASLTLSSLADDGLRIHALGYKIEGLRFVKNDVVSADSLAWSFNASKNWPLPGHMHRHCNNCLEWALDWRERLLASMGA